ncbi:hypothetical protein [Vibrio rumoiensis]|nr:hypothetical protein [Vibrio rumoiensis]
MKRVNIDGIDIEIGNKVYTTKHWYLAGLISVVSFILLNIDAAYENNTLEGILIILTVPLIFLIHEIHRMVYRPTLLAIGYAGIYSPKTGLIAWSNIESINYQISPSNSLLKSLIIYVKEPNFTMNYWFFEPIKMIENPIYIRMDHTGYDIKKAKQHADIMKSWYETWNSEANE